MTAERQSSPLPPPLRFDARLRIPRIRNFALFAIPRGEDSRQRGFSEEMLFEMVYKSTRRRKRRGKSESEEGRRVILSTFIPTPALSSSSSSSSRLLEFSSKSLRETGNRKNSFVDPVYPYRGFQAIVQIPARPSIKFHPPSSVLPFPLPSLSLPLSPSNPTTGASGNALRDWGR